MSCVPCLGRLIPCGEDWLDQSGQSRLPVQVFKCDKRDVIVTLPTSQDWQPNACMERRRDG